MAESEYNGKPGKWRTVKGRKVFFPDGEDEKAVINEAFGDDYKPSKKRINKGKFEKSDDGENWEELEDSQSYNDYYADEDEFDLNEDGDFEEGKLKIQVKYDGKQIEMEIPSNIEEDWQVDEAVKEKLEQIEGHEIENFEWDIASENNGDFAKKLDDAGYQLKQDEYGVEKKQDEEPVEGVANSEEDDAGSPYKEADRQWMKDHIEDNPDMSDKDLMDDIIERFSELSPDDEQFVKQLLAGRNKGPQAAAAGGGQPPEDDLDTLVNEYTEAKKSNDLERLAKAKAKLRNYLLGKPIEDQEGSPMAEFKKQTGK